MSECQYCHKQAELRPYGERGAMICFSCAMQPQNKSATERNFGMQLNACGDVALLDGTEVGPYPAKHHKDGKRIMKLLKEAPHD
jgi:hypothetical protein